MIKSVEATIKGKLPGILMHKYPMEPIEAFEKKTKEEQAELAAYRDPDTKMLYVPGEAVQRALISAAVFSKGKGRATLQKTAAACLIISPARLSLGVKDYVIDSRSVVIPATKGRVIRHRPMLEEWEITFALQYDDSLLTVKQVQQVVNDAGTRVGLLDFRPEHKGAFGRFVVISWKD